MDDCVCSVAEKALAGFVRSVLHTVITQHHFHPTEDSW